jgi:para-aminobenzoate synthetase/4-amino-4-deoxychorismate lyase
MISGRPSTTFELLETLRWTPAEGFFLLERHLARLRESASYFGFECSEDRVRQALQVAAGASDRPLRVRLLLANDGTVRTESSPLDPPAAVVRVRLASTPVDRTDVFLLHKTTNRAVYERARSPEVDDVILWNAEREITESTIANVVVEIDGRRVTPPVGCGLLPGTYRAELLATGAIVESPVTIDRFRTAPRFWLINSVRGWCPAVMAASESL